MIDICKKSKKKYRNEKDSFLTNCITKQVIEKYKVQIEGSNHLGVVWEIGSKVEATRLCGTSILIVEILWAYKCVILAFSSLTGGLSSKSFFPIFYITNILLAHFPLIGFFYFIRAYF